MPAGIIWNHYSGKKPIVADGQSNIKLALVGDFPVFDAYVWSGEHAGNILLDGNGSVKVADFGLSRLQAASCGEPLTAELGTWQWMAPEVVAPWDKKGAIYTEKADVYSFGIVMWECAAREVCKFPAAVCCIFGWW